MEEMEEVLMMSFSSGLKMCQFIWQKRLLTRRKTIANNKS